MNFKNNKQKKEKKKMKSKICRIALVAAIGTLAFVAGCEKEMTREEILRKQREDYIKAKADLERMKAEAEARRNARDEETPPRTIGGAMFKRTVEAASGTGKKDKEADDRVKRALDRDFGAPQPAPKKVAKEATE